MKKLFRNKHAYWSIFFLFIQQLIVASSTILISTVSGDVVEGRSFALFLGLFAASLFVVYIPGVASSYHLEKAKNKAIKDYTKKFSEANQNKPFLLSDKKITEDREPWLTNEGSTTIEEIYTTAYDSIAIGLNAGLNLAAICIAIDPRFIIGYGASILTIMGVSVGFKNKLSKSTETFQLNRKNLFQSLSFGWQNIVIGNKYNHTLWLNRFIVRWKAYNESSITAILWREFSASFAMVIALVPAIGNIIWLFQRTNNSAKMAALVATLPRQIQIIQNLREFCIHAMIWPGAYAKYKQLIKTIEPPLFEREAILNRIKMDDINFSLDRQKINFIKPDDFITFLRKLEKGRITIKGKNGSGKTTLLSVVKNDLGDQAYFLPIKSKPLFESTMDESLSTGLDVIASLNEIDKQVIQDPNQYQSLTYQQKYFIFDEWQASLDTTNSKKMSQLLDKLAQKRCIIEICHVPETNDRNDDVDIKSNNPQKQISIEKSASFSDRLTIDIHDKRISQSKSVLSYYTLKTDIEGEGNASSSLSPLLSHNRSRTTSLNFN